MRIFDAAARIRRSLLLALVLPAAALAQSVTQPATAAVTQSATQPDATAQPAGGPLNLLISYRSEPVNRPAFRTYLQKEGRARLEKFKHDGVLESYLVLFNPVTNSGTWDALIVLKFARYADTRRWMDIERTAPGGLSAAGLRLAKPVDSYFADLRWQGATDEAATERDSIYYVIPYEYSNAGEYEKYVDAYVVPQVKGWMREGVLSSYRLFMNRFGTGRPWDSLFVYQYRDLEAFGRRDEIVSKVRGTLVGDPVWKHYSDIKQTLRTESENTIAEDLDAGDAAGP
jgi:hypothetical protein